MEALKSKININIAVFIEDSSLINRDRQAAWFSEKEGAQVLLCSEIGSEGRNFQFAQHLVLFDLPPNPELLEQRIGRIDRLGQAAERITIWNILCENTIDARIYHRLYARRFYGRDFAYQNF